jgi:Domain of Unknown function (DUF542)
MILHPRMRNPTTRPVPRRRLDMPSESFTTTPIPRIDATLSVNDVLLAFPTTAPVFNAFGIDACCGGDRALEEAAREDGADLTALLAALEWAVYERDTEADA